MPAVITNLGKQRALELITADMTHIGVGRPDPSWDDEEAPPIENPANTNLVDRIGYAVINTRGWLTINPSGPIVVDNVHYQVSVSATDIAYVQATIPSGVSEGVGNKIGQVAIFGKNVVTNTPVNGWVSNANVTTAGLMYRIQHLPVFIKPANTIASFMVIFPLLA